MKFETVRTYKIYCEDVHEPGVLQYIVSGQFQAYTVHCGNAGMWRGVSENSLTVEIIDTPGNFLESVGVRTTEDAVELTAVRLCKRFGQEAVLVVRGWVDVVLVTG